MMKKKVHQHISGHGKKTKLIGRARIEYILMHIDNDSIQMIYICPPWRIKRPKSLYGTWNYLPLEFYMAVAKRVRKTGMNAILQFSIASRFLC